MENVGEYRKLAAWVAEEILPYEPLVRLWLHRAGASPADADDLIQEAYCKIMDALPHSNIERPSAFFFQITRNLYRNQIHRNNIVRIELGVDFERLLLIDEAPSPENIVAHRQEFVSLRRLLRKLPKRCRQIFEMRKIEGLSQKEIAIRLGVSENIVENDSAKGVRLVMEGLREQGSEVAERYENKRKSRIGAK